jgi:hypothetical protein
MKNSKSITTQTDATYYLFVVAPIEEIVQNLESGVKYRMDFLDAILEAYMKTATVSIGLSAGFVNQIGKPEIWNEYAKNYYLKYFEQLLQYFKNHK